MCTEAYRIHIYALDGGEQRWAAFCVMDARFARALAHGDGCARGMRVRAQSENRSTATRPNAWERGACCLRANANLCFVFGASKGKPFQRRPAGPGPCQRGSGGIFFLLRAVVAATAVATARRRRTRRQAPAPYQAHQSGAPTFTNSQHQPAHKRSLWTDKAYLLTRFLLLCRAATGFSAETSPSVCLS